MHDETTTVTEPRKRLPVGSADDALKRISVSSPFDTLGAMDLLHGYMLLRSTKHFHGVSEPFANALAHKVSKEGLSAIKSDELSYSTQAGFGDEWVPDLWSAQIWQKARLENAILPLFQAVEMPSNPFELPIEGTDPTVYFVPETTDEDHLALGSGNPIPDSKVGSGKVQLAAKKLALRVGFSSELVEDAVIPVLNIYREQALRAITDSIDYVLLNGDTASSGNINKNGGTPDATDRYMAFNGLRKLPLVTATANTVDAIRDADFGAAAADALQNGRQICRPPVGSGVDRGRRDLRQVPGDGRIPDDGEGRVAGDGADRADRDCRWRAGDRQCGDAADRWRRWHREHDHRGQHQRHGPVCLSSRLVRGLPPPHRRERGLSAVLRRLSTDRDCAAGLHQLRQ